VELRYGLYQSRTLQRPLPGLAPQACGLFKETRLGALARQQFRSGLCYFRKLALKGRSDTGVQRAALLAQERAVGCILH
jgi:hypothetical protein